MDARIARAAVLVVALASSGASYRTKNFIVSASTPQMAEEIGLAAEAYRKELAREWLGKELRPWAQPCPIVAQVGDRLGAGGATSFVFDHGEVFGWQMNIQGSHERILDSVLPHEITHTIFASHFREPLPRWADEGACTTVEHASERAKQHQMLIEFLKTRRGIAFNQMFAMKEYPRDVLPLYSQGYSLARFLIFQQGRRAFVEFLEEGLRGENWPQAIDKHYGYHDLGALQDAWLAWVREGSPALNDGNERLEGDAAFVLVSNNSANGPRRTRPQVAEPTIVRGNSPDREVAPIPNAYAGQSARSPRIVDRGDEAADWRSVKRGQSSDVALSRGQRALPERGSALPDKPSSRRPSRGSVDVAASDDSDSSASHAWSDAGNSTDRSATSLASADRGADAMESLTRAQPTQAYQATRRAPPEPVRQTILEWSREASSYR